MDNAIYIVFSATPTKMGRMIRLATRHGYNHVSLSLSSDIQNLYSFARHYQTVPLYGGFVLESILRYSSFPFQSYVKICRLPLEEDRLLCLRNELNRLWDERDQYIYNTPAALASLLNRNLYIPKAHTCATFVHDILCRYHLIDDRPNECPSIRSLERLLKDSVIYEGPIQPLAQQGRWGEDLFLTETTKSYAVYTTAVHFGRLAKRAFLGAM